MKEMGESHGRLGGTWGTLSTQCGRAFGAGSVVVGVAMATVSKTGPKLGEGVTKAQTTKGRGGVGNSSAYVT